jgi:HEPN domain-containing protein
MIPVADLDGIANARLEDARALYDAGRFDGAAYLCGYAVELALKARICRALAWAEFPNANSEFRSYQSFKTHDLDVLLHLSGQELSIKQAHFASWNVVVVWTPESRYNAIGSIQSLDAEAMILAAEELLAAL